MKRGAYGLSLAVIVVLFTAPSAIAHHAIQAEYDVPGEALRNDARLFFQDLEARGLVAWV